MSKKHRSCLYHLKVSKYLHSYANFLIYETIILPTFSSFESNVNCCCILSNCTNSEYWSHIRSHPGHENDSPPTSPRTTFGNRERYSRRNRSTRSFNRDSVDPTQLKVGKEYEVDITEISRQGDGIARMQGCMIFVKGGHIGEKVKIIITQTRSRFAIARTT